MSTDGTAVNTSIARIIFTQYLPLLSNISGHENHKGERPILLYVFFWVIPRRLNFICRRFETLCLFHHHRQVGVEFYTYLSMKMEQTECSETSAYTIQTPGNYPEENMQHTEHGESLKSKSPILSYFRNMPFHSEFQTLSDVDVTIRPINRP